MNTKTQCIEPRAKSIVSMHLQADSCLSKLLGLAFFGA
jgi:hypothetical protein